MGLVITTADAEAGSAGRLVGRIHERRLLDGLIESVEGGGAAALIVGEAGTGKTALLTHVAEVASNRVGLRVLRARGEESEAGLAFAALADMLLPLRERFTELPPAQRHALEGCLALSGGSSESAGKSQLGACAGTLRVLASVAAEHPVAVLVDDLQWVDPESRQILLFAAHRLAAERVVMILAVRDEPGAPPPELGLQVLRLGGLSVTECADLARRLGADISPPALRSLVELTGGNPLAVLENLPTAAAGPTGPAGPGGIGAIGVFEPARLTLGRVLEHAWGSTAPNPTGARRRPCCRRRTWRPSSQAPPSWPRMRSGPNATNRPATTWARCWIAPGAWARRPSRRWRSGCPANWAGGTGGGHRPTRTPRSRCSGPGRSARPA